MKFTMVSFEMTDELKAWLDEILAVYVSPEVTVKYESGQDGYRLCYGDTCVRLPVLKNLWSINYNNPSCIKTDDLVFLGIDILPIDVFADDAVHYDILGLAYWMLNRVEEIQSQNLDALGRFPASASHALKNGYLDRPIVDEWFLALRNHLRSMWPDLGLTPHQYQMVVSHDVDQPAYYHFRSLARMGYTMLSDFLRHKNWKMVFKFPALNWKPTESIPADDPYNSFDWLMAQSENQIIQSTFYFQAGMGRYYRDAHYSLFHPAIQNLIRDILGRGHNIGLHPSYRTYLSPLKIEREKEMLDKAIQQACGKSIPFGSRMHFLRWRSPDTLRALDAAGLLYDTTLGYADYIGFRCGTCREYPAYDPVGQKNLKIKIRPLIVMDQTVISKKYMNLGCGDDSVAMVAQYKRMCEKVGGNFTLLWHNSTLVTEAQKYYYQNLLKA